MRRPALALALTLAAPPAAEAQAVCADHQVIVEALLTEFGQTTVAMGLDQSGRVMEILISADTGTWTVVLTRPDDYSCSVLYGVAWQLVPGGRPL